MFTVYIDDSGTAPDQSVAVAAALIVPAKHLAALDGDWEKLRNKYGFSDLHASECVSRNHKSKYADWNDDKTDKALRAARKVMKKYACKAISLTIQKKDFDAEAPKEWFVVGGVDHFTWALRTVLNMIRHWNATKGKSAPLEYVFDWQEPSERGEVEMVMAQFESAYPGQYAARYIFKKRKEVPPLQCVDLLAWSCFARSRYAFHKTPMHPLAAASYRELQAHKRKKWLNAMAHQRHHLKEAIRRDCLDKTGEERRREWYAQWVKSQPNWKPKKRQV